MSVCQWYAKVKHVWHVKILSKVPKNCQFWTKRPKSPSRDHLPEKPRHCGYPILNAVLQYKVGHQSRLRTYPSLQIPSSHTTPSDQVPALMLQLQPWLPRIFATSWVLSRMTNAVPQMPSECFLKQHVRIYTRHLAPQNTSNLSCMTAACKLSDVMHDSMSWHYDFMIDVQSSRANVQPAWTCIEHTICSRSRKLEEQWRTHTHVIEARTLYSMGQFLWPF